MMSLFSVSAIVPVSSGVDITLPSLLSFFCKRDPVSTMDKYLTHIHMYT